MIIYGVLVLCLLAVTHGLDDESFPSMDDESFPKPAKTPCNYTIESVIGKAQFNYKNASTTCIWTFKPKNESSMYVMLEKLLLDDEDIVTIKHFNSTEVIFGPFHGQADAVILITGETEVDVELITSAKEVQRHFAVSYQSQACTFTIDNDIPTVTQPIYAANMSAPVTCNYEYVVKNTPNVIFAFSFESFNLSHSTIGVTGAVGISTTLQGSSLPPDFLSGKDQVAFAVNIDPKSPSDKFVLQKHNVYEECSSYKELNGVETLSSPQMPKLLDGDIPVECRWHIKNPNPEQALGVKFSTLNLDVFDMVVVTDGSRLSIPPFLQVSHTTETRSLAREIRTSSSEMIITFKPQTFASNFTAEVFAAGDGKYIRDNGTVKATTRSPRGTNGTSFLLEVDEGQTVVLDFKDFALDPSSALGIYEDFSLQSKRIATLRGNVWYPIISSTAKMMVVAINFNSGHFEGNFSGAVTGCMHMSPGSSDSYILSGNCNSTCSWIIPPIDSKDELLLDLQFIALEKDDVIQVLRLDSKKTVVAHIISNVTHVPQFSLNAEEGAYVSVTRGACPKTEDKIILVARSNYLPACSKNFTLSPSEKIQLTSPNYPDTYPLLSKCKTSILRSSNAQLLHLAFVKLDLAPNHCIQISQITKNGTNSFTVTGNQMPDDLLYVGDSIVEFNSGNCNTTKDVTAYISTQGFIINVTSTDCGGVVNDKTGKLVMPANKTICIWKISVPSTEKDGSVNIITYHTEEDKTGNYKLNVYDGSSVRDSVITNTTDSEIWSKTNALIFEYVRLDNSKPSAQITINYNTKSCSTSMQCANKICMHPDWQCNGVNDCGDDSDERNCNAVPVPPKPASPPPGISSVTFGICIIFFFAMGVAVTIFVPWAIQRYRNRYHQFNDLSVIE